MMTSVSVTLTYTEASSFQKYGFFSCISLRERLICENHNRQFSDVFGLPAFVSAVDKIIFFDRSRWKLEKETFKWWPYRYHWTTKTVFFTFLELPLVHWNDEKHNLLNFTILFFKAYRLDGQFIGVKNKNATTMPL